MISMLKSKVTVLRREFFPDLAEKYLGNQGVGPCSHFRDGQELVFDSENLYVMRGGFCTEAWDAISRHIYVQVSGGVVMKGWTNDE